MTEMLPSGVKAVRMGLGETRYVFPRRTFWYRVGWAAGPLLAGFVMSGIGILLVRVAWEGLSHRDRFGCAGFLTWGLMIPLWIAGLWLLALASWRFAAHSELHVDLGRVRAANRAFGLAFPRGWREGRLRSVEVASEGGRRARLIVSLDGGGTVDAAPGLPSELLNRFREEVQERHLLARPTPVPRPPPSGPPPERPRPQPPPGSRPRPVAPPRPRETTGIRFLSDSTPAPPGAPAAALAECQVCSTPMTEDLVACASCRTLHHKACWDYMKRCSTYACRGTRAVPAAKAGRESDVVVIAEEEGPDGRRRAGRKAVRQWLRELSAEHGWGDVRSRERKHRHCEVTFRVGRMVCTLEGRAQGGGLSFWMQAVLPSPEHQQRAAAVAIPPRYAWIERRVSEDRVELRPATVVDSLPLLRGFVRGCLGVLTEIDRT